MAPASHETTASAAGQQESPGVSPSYSTRSSKRKASEISSSEFYSSAPKPPSQDSQKTADEDDAVLPPKKIRRSTRASPESAELRAAIENSTEIPDIKVDSPAESGNDDAVRSPARVFRGGFRGRPRGGKPGRGGLKGGKGKAASRAIASGTPIPEAVGPSPSKRFRGRGGRVKQSDNAHIQSLYDRKAELRAHHRRVALIQRVALEALSEKSLQMLKATSDSHKNCPEYDVVEKSLRERYEKVRAAIQARTDVDQEYRESWLKRMQENEELKFQARVNDIMDTAVHRIKQQAIFVVRQSTEGGTVDNTPLYRGAEGKVVKRIAPPSKIVHHVGTPYNKGFLETTGNKPQLSGGYEVSPGEWWRNLSAQERRDWTAQEKKTVNEIHKSSTRTAIHKKSSLYAVVGDEMARAMVEDAASAIATPGETSEKEADEGASSETQSDAEEQPTDKLGVYLPKKPVPRNGEAPQNRIVLDPPVTFESDEIGIRVHHYKKNNKNEMVYLGMDDFQNPKKLHLDQVARGHNSAKNRPEDLNQDLVEAFGVHPTYGLPLDTSKNPDPGNSVIRGFESPTDWAKPLEPTTPIIIIEESPDTSELPDFEKKTFLTSRSAWMVHVDREWERYPAQQRMVAALEGINAREPRPRLPQKVAPLEKPKEPEVIDHALLDAVAKAVKEAKKPKPLPPPPPSPAKPPPPARSYGYDPVRDTGYESRPSYGSPYRSIFHRTGTNLAALADAAELRSGMPPPSAFRANRPWFSTPSTVGPPLQPAPQHPATAPVPILPQPAPIQPHRPGMRLMDLYHHPPAARIPGTMYPGLQPIHPAQAPNHPSHSSHHHGPSPDLAPPVHHTRFYAYSHPPPPQYAPQQRHVPSHLPGPSPYRELRPAPPQNRGPPPPQPPPQHPPPQHPPSQHPPSSQHPPPPQHPPPSQPLQQPPQHSPQRWYGY